MFDLTSTAVLVLVTIAIVNRIKAEVPLLKDYFYTLISFGVGAALYFIGVYAPVAVTVPLAIGLTASGIFDATKKN
jgi:hypothetical protein